MALTTLSRIIWKRYLVVPSISHCLNNSPKHKGVYSTKTSIIKNKTEDKKVAAAEIIKRNLKSTGYLGIIISGIGITAFVLYTLFSELFSSESVNAIYSKARIRCMEHPKIIELLGAPIKAYGDETKRRRRKHISHMYYIKNGIEYMRLKFYLKGTMRLGTAFVEMKKNESGKYEYSYLYVMVNHFGIIVIEPEQDMIKDIQQD